MEELSVAGTTDLLHSYQTGGGALSEARRKTQDNLGRVMASYHGAKSMTRVAVNYLKEEGDKDRFYKTYFGGNAIGDVIRNFEAIAYDNSPGRNLKCNDHCGSSSHPNSHRDGISMCRQNECMGSSASGRTPSGCRAPDAVWPPLPPPADCSQKHTDKWFPPV